MGFIAAADPASKAAYVFTSTSQLHGAIKERAYIPIRPDGTEFIVQIFEDGYLLDGAPMNVYIEDQWFAGQKELLAPYWAAGTIPKPTEAVLGIGEVALPEDIAENYRKFKTTGGVPTWLVGGAALVALFLLKK